MARARVVEQQKWLLQNLGAQMLNPIRHALLMDHGGSGAALAGGDKAESRHCREACAPGCARACGRSTRECTKCRTEG